MLTQHPRGLAYPTSHQEHEALLRSQRPTAERAFLRKRKKKMNSLYLHPGETTLRWITDICRRSSVIASQISKAKLQFPNFHFLLKYKHIQIHRAGHKGCQLVTVAMTKDITVEPDFLWGVGYSRLKFNQWQVTVEETPELWLDYTMNNWLWYFHSLHGPPPHSDRLPRNLNFLALYFEPMRWLWISHHASALSPAIIRLELCCEL